MEKRKTLHIILIIATALIFIVMGVSFAAGGRDSASAPESFIGTLLEPGQKLFSKIGNGIGGFLGFVVDMKDFQEENIELKEQVAALSEQVRALEASKDENERLRQLLELKAAENGRDTVGCEVIAKDPGNWFYSFTIDKGSDAGIALDDTVISGHGLVGRISEVAPGWAKVQSIIDVNSSVGALISRTQDFAIADGDLALADSGKCKLNYVTKDTNLVLGDAVVTSGLGGVYPEGILIGTVSEIKSDSLGYSQYAVIDTAVDFERIREVLVIRNGGANHDAE